MNSDQACSAVLDTLQKATSQNADLLKPAEQQLKEWESQQGFYSILLVGINLRAVKNPIAK